jgi:hypothetical protein
MQWPTQAQSIRVDSLRAALPRKKDTCGMTDVAQLGCTRSVRVRAAMSRHQSVRNAASKAHQAIQAIQARG